VREQRQFLSVTKCNTLILYGYFLVLFPRAGAAFAGIPSKRTPANPGKLCLPAGIELVQYMKLRPDVVFMDITMPEMEGVEVVQTVMDRDASAKIVMVSSNCYQELIKEALDSGAKHFLTKPVEATQVASVVNFVLGEG
jgi:two-component system chemotaxis response regulator CheY